MAIDVGAITQRRKKERDAVKTGGEQGEMIRLELQYIADTLEAIRGEVVLANVTERARKAAK